VPDWILFVSANAVRGLAAACSGRDLGRARVAAVGERTADAAREAGWEVHLVAQPESAEGLVAALSGVERAGRTFWIPRGNREGSARDVLPIFLEGGGARVESFAVYATLDRPLTAEDAAALAGAPPGVVVLHSPSAVDALFRADQPEPVAVWRDRARFLAIGPRTLERLGERGRGRALVCPEPSDEAVLGVLSVLPVLRVRKVTP
jgi:uroporphyrinogen-III synthase